MTRKQRSAQFDWPDEIPESDFDDTVNYWPIENLAGVERPEAIKRIDALVNQEITTAWQAQVAIWFWGEYPVEYPVDFPTADRPDSSDPDWANKAMIALGRAAMRGRLVNSYDTV